MPDSESRLKSELQRIRVKRDRVDLVRVRADQNPEDHGEWDVVGAERGAVRFIDNTAGPGAAPTYALPLPRRR